MHINIFEKHTQLSKRYVRYLIIGVLSNVLSFAIFSACSYLAIRIDVSASIGMTFGILNTYTLGRMFLKEKPVKHSHKTAIIVGTYYFIAILITSRSIELLGSTQLLSYNFSWLSCTIVASIVNFIFLNNYALKNTE
jgi:putative flippase GtrA